MNDTPTVELRELIHFAELVKSMLDAQATYFTRQRAVPHAHHETELIVCRRATAKLKAATKRILDRKGELQASLFGE